MHGILYFARGLRSSFSTYAPRTKCTVLLKESRKQKKKKNKAIKWQHIWHHIFLSLRNVLQNSIFSNNSEIQHKESYTTQCSRESEQKKRSQNLSMTVVAASLTQLTHVLRDVYNVFACSCVCGRCVRWVTFHVATPHKCSVYLINVCVCVEHILSISKFMNSYHTSPYSTCYTMFEIL